MNDAASTPPPADDVDALRAEVARLRARLAVLDAAPEAAHPIARQLHEARAVVDAVVNNAPVGIGLFDRDLRYVHLNDALAEMNGLPREAHLGHTIPELLPGLDVSVIDAFRHVIDTGEPLVGAEAAGETPAQPGRRRYWSVSYYPVRDADRRILGAAAICEEITERKHTDDALRHSQERVRAILESISDAFFAVDAEWRITYVNRQAEPLLRYQSQELIGRSLWEVFPDAVGTPFYEQYHRALREQVPVAFTAYYDELSTWFDVHAYPFEDGLSVFFTDVTERKAQEEALRQSAEQLRFLGDAMPHMVWIAEPDGYCVYFNRRWYEYTGLPAGSSEGWAWIDIIHPDDHEHTVAAWQRSIRTGEPYLVEYRMRRHDGAWRWQSGRGLPRLDEHGVIAQWVGTCTDVHDRRMAEEARERLMTELARERRRLAELNETLEARVDERTAQLVAARATLAETNAHLTGIIESTPDLIAALDADYHFLAFNDAYRATFERIVGVAPTVGACLPDLVGTDPARRSRATAIWNRALAGESFTMTQTYGADTDPDRRVFEVSYNPITADDGRRLGAALFARDVTDRILASETLARTNARLEEANRTLQHRNRELQDFAYVASHDLQEPLRKIQAFSDLLLNEHADGLDPEGRLFLDRMRDAAYRMSRLLVDLLAFSRVTTRGQPFEPVDLTLLLRGLATELTPRLAETGATLHVEPLPTLNADPSQLRRLFLALLDNALKFARPGVPPRVRIYVADPPDPARALICVEDNGIGFDEKYADRIFGPFQRLHARGQYEGTGMGLALARRIAERHGGAITARSTPGHGATFILSLPLHGTEAFPSTRPENLHPRVAP